MMLRCSYACLSVGLAFVNSCPVIAPNDAKKAGYSSIISEWMGKLIMIYNEFKRRLVIVRIGADPDEAIKDVFKSFKDTSSMMSHYNTVNQAKFSRMNITKTKTASPIAPEPLYEGMPVAEIVGKPLTRTRDVTFDWCMYNPSVLESDVEIRFNIDSLLNIWA